jgi:thioredoxin 2
MALQIDDRGVIVACSGCGRRNRVPYAAREAKCGGCGAALGPRGAPLDVPDAPAFDALISASPIPVLVDFWAPWCAPCRVVAPELERVAAANAGRLYVAKVNTDAVPELGERFRIRSIPTMAVFEGGREVSRTSGARPAPEIEGFVRQALGGAEGWRGGQKSTRAR